VDEGPLADFFAALSALPTCLTLRCLEVLLSEAPPDSDCTAALPQLSALHVLSCACDVPLLMETHLTSLRRQWRGAFREYILFFFFLVVRCPTRRAAFDSLWAALLPIGLAVTRRPVVPASADGSPIPVATMADGRGAAATITGGAARPTPPPPPLPPPPLAPPPPLPLPPPPRGRAATAPTGLAPPADAAAVAPSDANAWGSARAAPGGTPHPAGSARPPAAHRTARGRGGQPRHRPSAVASRVLLPATSSRGALHRLPSTAVQKTGTIGEKGYS